MKTKQNGEKYMSKMSTIIDQIVERNLSEYSGLTATDVIDNAEMIDVVKSGGELRVYIQWDDNSDTALTIRGNRVTEITSAKFGGYASEFERLFTDQDIKYLLTSAKYK